MYRITWLSCLFSILLIFPIAAQAPIRYHVDLDNIVHHEIEVTIDFPALNPGVLYLRMPRSSPGRYAEHNFAKNVYNVRAFDAQGKALTVYRDSPHTWSVAGHNGAARVQYTLYGNHADGTYTGIDNRKVHMNMPATFLYGAGMPDRPIEITFALSDRPGWTVATQLQPLSDSVFRAPNYYYFYDSPTMVGPIDYRRWTSSSNGRDYTIEIAMLHEGTDAELDSFAEMSKKVVEEQKAIYGELPDFDFGRYTFLCSYNPWVFGDGMEHRNSTVCTAPASLAQAASGLIGTISHEFFHAWNVERLRPRSLEPFDFDRANMSGELWFAEGFTSYYDGLTLVRAGLRTPAGLAEEIAGLLNYVALSPGRELHSPVEMSHLAPFVDAATAVDETNFANTFISYYPYGALVGLVLDLELRTRFPNVTLDTFMRAAWQRFGQPEVPYAIPDLQRVLADVTGDAAFAEDFFRRSIYGSELPDMTKLLAPFGFTVRLQNPDTAGFFGLSLNYDADGATVQSPILKNNPLYAAGLTEGDLIKAIDDRPVTSEAEFEAIQNSLKISRSYQVRFVQRGEERTANFTAAQDPTYEVQLTEDVTGKELDKRQAERRAAWLR